MQMMIKEINIDIEVHLFENAESLFEKIKESPNCDYVFTDINMGGNMNGLDLIKEIRKLKIPCKAYVISNTLKSKIEEQVYQSGADGYFEAPIQKHDLTMIIQS